MRKLSLLVLCSALFVACGTPAPAPSNPGTNPGPTNPGPTDPAPTDPAPTDPVTPPVTPPPTDPVTPPVTPPPTDPAPQPPAPTPAPAPAPAPLPPSSVQNPIPMAYGSQYSGVIAGEARRMDYFSFTASEGERLMLRAEALPGSTLDPYMWVLLPDGHNVYLRDDDSGEGNNAEIRMNVPMTGRYYVVVTSFKIHNDPTASDNLMTNTYRLSLMAR